MNASAGHTKGREEGTLRFSRGDRLKFWIVSHLGYWIIRSISGTLRWRVEGWDHVRGIQSAGRNMIIAFWHGRIFMGTYYFRDRGIVVMTSRNRDGEYIAGVIRRFGYGVARGSSSRGGRRALVEMIWEIRTGHDVAFTIDGPTGPRYVAKPGAVWIASKTGAPILPFHVSAERNWTLDSWDLFQIPKPFSRVILIIGEPIYVRKDADQQELDAALAELQASLEDLLRLGDGHWTAAAEAP